MYNRFSISVKSKCGVTYNLNVGVGVLQGF